MNEKRSPLYWIFSLIIIVWILVLSIIVFCQNNIINNNKIMFSYEVDMDRITNTEILSASLESFHPHYNFELENPAEIYDLVSTIDNAVFLPAKKPNKITWSDSVSVEGRGANYTIGLYNNSILHIKIDGVSNYYKCSGTVAFAFKLAEIQGAPINRY